MSKRFRRLSHSLYECKYHIVFCPKYRHRILKDEVAEYTKHQIYQLLGQKDDMEVIELNVQEDHVHLVLWIAPKYAVSDVVGFLKGKLTLKLFGKYAPRGHPLGRKYWGRHLWARGYCVSRVPSGCGIDEEHIRKYVQWQEQQERQAELTQGKLFDE